MLADNKIRVNAEETLKEEKKNKYTWGHPQKMNLESEYSESTNHEYKEIQEIKNTYSTYLREVLKNCDKVDSLENLENGQLIRIDDVKLEILNKEEILEANSLLSGAFNGNTLDTYSDGHMFKININSLTNMILKDYKYHLNCIKGKENFYIDIPMKAEKEFENEYSIYDLEVGHVNIIGIYRTKKYDPNNKTTYSKLQELGNRQDNDVDEMKSSRKKEEVVKTTDSLKSSHYVDLIAIIQDLSFFREGNENNEK